MQGHVDATGEFLSMKLLGDDNWWMRIRVPEEIQRFLASQPEVEFTSLNIGGGMGGMGGRGSSGGQIFVRLKPLQERKVSGQIVAERYAPGKHADMPLPGWSVAKSVLNALSSYIRHGGVKVQSATLITGIMRGADGRVDGLTIREAGSPERRAPRVELWTDREVRFVNGDVTLAATLSPTWGVYAGYELFEHVVAVGAQAACVRVAGVGVAIPVQVGARRARACSCRCR